MFGLIFLVGQLLSALALGIIFLMWIADEDVIASCAPTRMLDLGNLMLTFVMLWAYTSFSQFLIIWSGNLPDRNPWYIHRLGGGWQWVALAACSCVSLCRPVSSSAKPVCETRRRNAYRHCVQHDCHALC